MERVGDTYLKYQFTYTNIRSSLDLSGICARRVCPIQVIRISGRKFKNKAESSVSSANPKQRNTEVYH